MYQCVRISYPRGRLNYPRLKISYGCDRMIHGDIAISLGCSELLYGALAKNVGSIVKNYPRVPNELLRPAFLVSAFRFRV